MSETHTLHIIDFEQTVHNTIFVTFAGYDAVLEKKFEGEVKFLGGLPYGDIVHQERTTLSPECRQFVQETLLEKFKMGAFD